MLAYHESSNKPPFLFRERKLISLPSPLSFFTNKCWTVLINHNCKTLCGLIQHGLFTNWKFRFVFDPRLCDLQRLVRKLSTLLNSSPIDELGNWCLKSQWGRARGNSGTAGRSPWQPGKREPPQQQPLTGTVTLKLVQWKYLPNPILTSAIKKPSGTGGWG